MQFRTGSAVAAKTRRDSPSPVGASLDQGAAMTGVSPSSLILLAEQLNDREKQVLDAVERFRLTRGDQLRRLFFNGISTEAGSARLCRRSLARLADAGLLTRLGRRVGGTRAGSSGHVFAITAAGRRLNAYLSGSGKPSNRGVHEPGQPFVAHTLAIVDLYVALVEAERAGTLELLAFETEPGCWRTFNAVLGTAQTLKPDAHVRIAADDYEYASFVEVDCGTEGKGALLRKAHVYLSYYRSGREQAQQGLFPKVVWLAATENRTRFLSKLLLVLPDGDRLFTAAMTAQAVGVLSGTSASRSEEAAS